MRLSLFSVESFEMSVVERKTFRYTYFTLFLLFSQYNFKFLGVLVSPI